VLKARTAASLCAGVLTCAVEAACSSSSSPSSAASPNTASPAAAASSGGGAAPAKGTYTIPFINDEGATNGASYPNETSGATAAVDYINNVLGGVNGYKLKLDVCREDGSPAAVTNCANRAVAAKPIVVTMGTVGADNDVVAVTSKANIPLFVNSGFSSQVLGSAGKSFVISSSGTTGMLGIAKSMQEKGIKSAAIIYVNVPGSVGTLQSTAAGYKKAGLTVKTYPVPYPSPDLTSTLSAIAGTSAQAVVLLADETTCTAGLKAAVSLGYGKPIYGVGSCASPSFAQVAGQYQASVALTQGSVSLAGDDPDAKVYQAAMKNYGAQDAVADDFHTTDGFQTIMDLYAALKVSGAPVTAASLQKSLTTMKFHQFLVGPSADFQCNGKALPSSPSVCSVVGDISTYDGSQLGQATAVNVSSLIG
jgi:branched-chain amino acid transport system substrate-binding protein